jgi:hypothetical protein
VLENALANFCKSALLQDLSYPTARFDPNGHYLHVPERSSG